MDEIFEEIPVDNEAETEEDIDTESNSDIELASPEYLDWMEADLAKNSDSIETDDRGIEDEEALDPMNAIILHSTEVQRRRMLHFSVLVCPEFRSLHVSVLSFILISCQVLTYFKIWDWILLPFMWDNSPHWGVSGRFFEKISVSKN
jgi:hypothetical protein